MSVVRKNIVSTGLTPIGDRKVRGRFSGPGLDDMGDEVSQSGIDLSDYMRNPVVLRGHDQLCAIGTASNLKIENGYLTGTVTFPPAGASEVADETYNLIKCGVLRSFSIGFSAIESVPLDPSRPRGGQRYVRSKLIEVSVVACPAHPGATITDKARATQAAPVPATKAARQARAAELAAGGAEPPARATAHIPHVSWAMKHAAEVVALQRQSHPDRAARIARASALERGVK